MKDSILLSITLLIAFVSVGKPRLGALGFVVYAIWAPQGSVWGFAQTFPHSMVISIGVLVGYLITREKSTLPAYREVVLLWALFFWFVFSSLSAFLPAEAFLRLKEIGKMLLMVLVTLSLSKGEKHIRQLLLAMAVPLGLFAIKASLFSILTGGQYTVEGPDFGFLAGSNAVGLGLSMNLPLLFYLAKTAPSVWGRWFLWGLFFVSYPAVACTFSRGTWIAAGIVTGFLVLKSKNKFLVWTAAAMLVLASPVIIPSLVSQRLAARFDTLHNLDEDQSANIRKWNMENCWRTGAARPLTGAGFNFYSLAAYAVFFPEFLSAHPGVVHSCHSMWLTVWAEHGLPGFVLWVGVLTSVVLSLRQVRKLAKKEEKVRWAVMYADMLLLTLLSYCISGTVQDAAYFDSYYYTVSAAILLKATVLGSLREIKANTSTADEVVIMRRPTFARAGA